MKQDLFSVIVRRSQRSPSSHRIRILIVLALNLALLTACLQQTRKFALSEPPAPANAVNINSATPAELEKLPGVGKVLAQKIVAHRERFGPFQRTAHLMMVDGISERKFRALSHMVTVQ